jgi:hypothetical protein
MTTGSAGGHDFVNIIRKIIVGAVAYLIIF